MFYLKMSLISRHIIKAEMQFSVHGTLQCSPYGQVQCAEIINIGAVLYINFPNIAWNIKTLAPRMNTDWHRL